MNNFLLTSAPALTPVLPLTTAKPIRDDDNDVSDISGEEDFHPGNNIEGGNPTHPKKSRILWTPVKEAYLLRCYNHYRVTCWNTHG